MTKNAFKHSLVFIAFSLFSIGCYSFRGVSIDPDTKSYSVSLFSNNAPAAPPTLAQNFTERLKDKVRNNTRLSLVNTEGADLQFSGQIVGYDVVALAPQPGQTATFNQLRISINVELVDNKNDKNGFKQIFSFQADFPGSGQLLQFQEQLIKTITDKLLEDIFNKAFTENW